MSKGQRKSPRFRIQRRLMVELPGMGKANALKRKPYSPGEHGQKRKKYSEYSLQLEEKQKVLMHYGLREKQLRRFIRDAKRGKVANWTDKLIGLLECRLDNVVFRLGFAPSIRSAKQLVSHGNVLVNNQKRDISSEVLRPGDKVTLKEKIYENQTYLTCKENPRLELAPFLERNQDGKIEVGELKERPGIDVVPFPFTPSLFTEYYSIRGV